MHYKSAGTRIHASSMKQKTSPFMAKQPSIQACRAHLTNALSSDQTASEIHCGVFFFPIQAHSPLALSSQGNSVAIKR